MAATKFVATIKFVCGTSRRAFSQRLTVSDVNAEFWLSPDGQSSFNLPAGEGTVYLVDVLCSNINADTSQHTIYANGKNTGELIGIGNNLATNVSRQFSGMPLAFKAGTNLRIIQAT